MNIESSIWKKAIQTGLIGGVISLLLGVVGMVAAFENTYLISGVITMGQILILAPFLFESYSAIRHASSKQPLNLLVVGGLTGLDQVLHVLDRGLRRLLPFDAMAVSALMTASGSSRASRHLLNWLFALVSPLGAFLFYLGVVFAYFVVFPLVFGFLTAAAPEGVAVMTDITKYLDFVLTMFFAFGICFEVPIFTIVMVWTGLVTPAALAEKRPYVIVAAFIIGAFLTPPDAISQTLLAVPMWMLFEAGLLCSRLFVHKESSDYDYPDDVEQETRLDKIEPKED